ncbi:MAG: HIT family protein [Pseudomonadota bacterium]
MTRAHAISTEACLFCRIAAGEVAVHEVFRDAELLAFLDTGPIREGHVQIIPIQHIATFEDLPPALGTQILQLGQRIARVQKRLYSVERVAFMFTGGDIPHVHAHLVPMHEKTDVTSRRYITNTDLTWAPRPQPAPQALRKTAEAIAKGLLEERA